MSKEKPPKQNEQAKVKSPKQKGQVKVKAKKLALQIKDMWKTPLKGRYLTLKESTNFGLYALGVSVIMCSVNSIATIGFIPYFYEINTIHAYIIIAISGLVNMLLLPYISNRIEKTKTKWGKYKPYILFSLPLFSLFAVMATWIPQFEGDWQRILYAYMSCTPLLIVSTFFNNMYQMMPTVITPNSQERADIMTPIGLIFGFAPTILNLVMGPIRAHFIKMDMEYIAVRIIGITSVILGVLLVMFILKVKEKYFDIKEEDDKEEKVKFNEAFKMVMKNKAMIILCIALILGSLRDFVGQFRLIVLQLKLSSDVDTALKISGIPLTVIGFASTVAMLLLPIVTRKMNKNMIMITFTGITVAANAILGIVGYENIPEGPVSIGVITILHFFACLSPVYLLIPIMLGEIADYQQNKTGKRLDGWMQIFIFVIPAFLGNLFMMATWFWQTEIGFEPKYYLNQPFVSDALRQIAYKWFDIASYISAGSGLLLMIVMMFYPLSKKKHQQLVEELNSKSTITNVDSSEVMMNDIMADTATTSNMTEIAYKNIMEEKQAMNMLNEASLKNAEDDEARDNKDDSPKDDVDDNKNESEEKKE